MSKMEVNKIVCGDCLEVMKDWPDKSVNCCVTSPPYWGLRDYGTATWEGGDAECDHLKKGKPTWGLGSTGSSTLSGRPRNDSHERESFTGGYCRKCGAKRIDNQLGLEKTPDCGRRGLLTIRTNLTDREKKAVMKRLEELGLL